MSEAYRHLETQLVHAGEPLPRIAGAVEMPIFQSATYEYAGEGSYHDVRYLRTNNTPSQLALHAKIAALEKAPASTCDCCQAAIRASRDDEKPSSFGSFTGAGSYASAALVKQSINSVARER